MAVRLTQSQKVETSQEVGYREVRSFSSWILMLS